MKNKERRTIELLLHFLFYCLILSMAFAGCAPMEGTLEDIMKEAGAGAGTGTTVPKLPGSVSIIGDKWLNATLAADTSKLFAYQWKRGGDSEFYNISGATGTTYTVVEADKGQDLYVTVTRIQSDESVTSAAFNIPIDAPTGIYDHTQLADIVQDLNGNYILGSDILIPDSTPGQDNTWITWKPIGYISGSETKSFAGTLDGNGKTINMGDQYFITVNSVPRTTFVNFGLFGIIGSGEVKNLKLTGKIRTTTHNPVNPHFQYFGSVAGVLGGGTIRNVSSSVRFEVEVQAGISSSYTYRFIVGGLVGSVGAGGIVENCYYTGNIHAGGLNFTWVYAGGIAGETSVYECYIQNCWAQGGVTAVSANGIASANGTAYAGGIIGYANKVTVQNCAALHTSANGVSAGSSDKSDVGRIIGYEDISYKPTPLNNYANDTMRVYPEGIPITSNANGKHGESVSPAAFQQASGSWWNSGTGPAWASVWGGANPTEDKPWKWMNNRPILWFEQQINQ